MLTMLRQPVGKTGPDRFICPRRPACGRDFDDEFDPDEDPDWEDVEPDPEEFDDWDDLELEPEDDEEIPDEEFSDDEPWDEAFDLGAD